MKDPDRTNEGLFIEQEFYKEKSSQHYWRQELIDYFPSVNQ